MGKTHELIPDGFLVRVQVFNLHLGGLSRVCQKSVLVDRGSGHQIEVLKCERAAHQLAVVMCAELAEAGWAMKPGSHRPPIGPERQLPPHDPTDPTSGEGSPL